MSSRRSRNGGNGDRKDSQAIVEVAAKLTVRHHFFQVTIRCRHEPDIYGNRARAAQPLELLFLQGPQEFRLQLRGKVSDFVEEQRTLVGQFQSANFLRDGSGEGAFFVAE